jgi:hypothetical protein
MNDRRSKEAWKSSLFCWPRFRARLVACILVESPAHYVPQSVIVLELDEGRGRPSKQRLEFPLPDDRGRPSKQRLEFPLRDDSSSSSSSSSGTTAWNYPGSTVLALLARFSRRLERQWKMARLSVRKVLRMLRKTAWTPPLLSVLETIRNQVVVFDAGKTIGAAEEMEQQEEASGGSSSIRLCSLVVEFCA